MLNKTGDLALQGEIITGLAFILGILCEATYSALPKDETFGDSTTWALALMSPR